MRRVAALATVLIAVPTAVSAVPIPSLPGPLLVPSYVGAPATARPIASFPVPQNPFLAPNGRSNMHNDAYGTNAYSWSGPLGRKPAVTSALYGVAECATLAFDSGGRIVGLCGLLSGPVLRLINPHTLGVLAGFGLPGRKFNPAVSPLSDLCGGTYFYLDQADRVVVATTKRTIEVVKDTGTHFVLQHTYDLASVVPSTDCLIALMPDWSGHVWFETGNGIVGELDPGTGIARTVQLTGEIIDNSFSVDETGGVYVVSDHAMYRFDLGPSGPVISWRQPYDRGSVKKPGQLAQGSGTTPTLLGANLVAITDNADPRMDVVVYDRSTGAFVCSAPVFAPGASDTENSLTAVGNSLFVENNYGYVGPQSTLAGKTTSPGVARVDVTGGQCSVAWTSQEIAPTSVPKASLANGLLYVYTKPKALLEDAWYLTAIDIRNGHTAFSKLAGTGPQYNNHYAAIYLGPDGSAYIATLTGMVRVHDSY
jgi:hypothetical protein